MVGLVDLARVDLGFHPVAAQFLALVERAISAAEAIVDYKGERQWTRYGFVGAVSM